MKHKRIASVAALLLIASCTSPGGTTGLQGPAQLNGGSGRFQVTVQSQSQGPVLAGCCSGTTSSQATHVTADTYRGTIHSTGGESQLAVELRVSGTKVTGMYFRNYFLQAGEGLEFTSAVLHASHNIGTACTGAGIQLSATGNYTIDGVRSDYTATVSSVWCDAAMAAYFTDS